MSREEIGTVLRKNLRVVPNAWDMHGKNYNCECHLEINDMAYQIIGEGDIEKGKQIVEDYLKETNGQI